MTQANLAQHLRNLGVRETAHRLAISEVVVNSLEHPSAQQIYEAVNERFPYITRSTIYNTLNALVRCGFVQALPFVGGVRYDANLDPHVNVVCIDCGAIIDVPVHKHRILQLKERVASISGFEITSQRLDFYGRCPSCAYRIDDSRPNGRHPNFPT